LCSRLGMPSSSCRSTAREHEVFGCERREIAHRRTEKERAEAFFPLRATTTAADPCAMREQPSKGQPSTLR
jgi:hypothetical protein